MAMMGTGARKAPAVGASKTEEMTMKLLTRFDLASRSKPELHALHRAVFNALARSAPASAERRNALASLDNIAAEIAARMLWP